MVKNQGGRDVSHIRDVHSENAPWLDQGARVISHFRNARSAMARSAVARPFRQLLFRLFTRSLFASSPVASSLIALAILIVAPNTLRAQSDAALAQIQKMVARPPVMCGEFDQQKTLVGLKRPVRSTGRFCALTEKGVLWNTLTPFASTLRLSREEIVQSQGDRVTSRLSAREEPTVGVISELLFSVLAGDFDRLRAGFKLEATALPTTWHAKLVPKESGMKRVISAIELNGSDFVRQITMIEASGDRTVISFANIATGPTALQPDEAKTLGLPAGRGSSER